MQLTDRFIRITQSLRELNFTFVSGKSKKSTDESVELTAINRPPPSPDHPPPLPPPPLLSSKSVCRTVNVTGAVEKVKSVDDMKDDSTCDEKQGINTLL